MVPVQSQVHSHNKKINVLLIKTCYFLSIQCNIRKAIICWMLLHLYLYKWNLQMYSVGKFDKSTTTTTKESIACFLWKKNPKKTSPLKKKKRTASLLPDQNIDSCVIYKLFVSVSWFAGCKCKKKRRKLRKRLYMSRRFDYGKCSQIHSYLRLRPLTSFMYSGVTITILDTNALDLNDVQWCHSVSYLILRPLTSFVYSGVTVWHTLY